MLLEAGGDESFLGQVPAMAADLQLTERDWQFKTEVLSGQACLGMENQRYGEPAFTETIFVFFKYSCNDFSLR